MGHVYITIQPLKTHKQYGLIGLPLTITPEFSRRARYDSFEILYYNAVGQLHSRRLLPTTYPLDRLFRMIFYNRFRISARYAL